MIVASEGSDCDLGERLDIAYNFRNWRKRECLPRLLRPLVEKAKAQFAAEFHDLSKLTLRQFWWIIEPWLLREGLINEVPEP